MSAFPTCRPSELEDRPRQRDWLVERLWSEQAVGILGGEPKCGKTFLALDIAVAVASAAPCLRHFAVPRPGPVLLYAAEDAGHVVRQRLRAIAAAAEVAFESLDIAVIDTPVLRLDRAPDQAKLTATLAQAQPRLLILDPLVRLHGVDENAVGEIAPILAFLRGLQRRFGTAVLVVHHARKSGAERAGQALRGSGELFAWCDSMAYLRRRRKQILMSVEHRAAPAMESVEIALADGEHGPALRVKARPSDGAPATERDPESCILTLLEAAEHPLSQRQLRERARLRNTTVSTALEALCAAGAVQRCANGYSRKTGGSLLDQLSAPPPAGPPVSPADAPSEAPSAP